MEPGDYERQLHANEAELAELREQSAILEDEVVMLRRRLQDAPKRVRTLEERLLETKGQLAQAVSQNEKLTYTLREAREHISALREEARGERNGTCPTSTHPSVPSAAFWFT